MRAVLLAVKNNKLRQTLSDACADRGFEPAAAADLEEAETLLATRPFAALLIDLGEFGTKSEKKIIAKIEALAPKVKILALGGGFALKFILSLYRAGLTDFVSLPPEPLELNQALSHILSPQFAPDPPPAAAPSAARNGQAAPAAPKGAGKPLSKGPLSGKNVIGQSPAFLKLFRVIEKVARSDSTVMIHGETGTGKELIARLIHLSSPRRDGPLIPVNCGAIPEELLEPELFGHEKGAFTNALRERVGRFEMAHGGTIFLDEIGDMSPKLQVKILRVLQEREFERVGGEKTIGVDIRVIAATHVDLAQAVEARRFRQDLFYRLNVIPVTVPPLRERAEDIPLLVDYFLGRFRESAGSRARGLSPEALSLLMAYRWPGNIRELENIMERMVILAEGEILGVEDLPARLRQNALPPVTSFARLKSFLEPTAEAPAPEEAPPFFPPEDNRGANQEPAPEPEGEIASETGQESVGEDEGATSSFSGASSGTENESEKPAESLPPAPPADSDAYAEALALAPETLSLWAPLRSFPVSGVDLNALLREYESKLIQGALDASGGQKNVAARLLGINRTTLQEKLRKKESRDLT
jgi:DNA-binding NtrC family response regulator